MYTDTLAVVTSPHIVSLQPAEIALDITCHKHVSAVMTHNFRCYVFGSISGSSHVRMQVVDLMADLSLPPDIVPSSLNMCSKGCFISTKTKDDLLQSVISQEIKILSKVCQILDIMKQVTSPRSSSNTHLVKVTSALTSLRRILTYNVDLSRSSSNWQFTGLVTHMRATLVSVSRLCSAVCDCVAGDMLLLDNHYQDLIPNIVTTLSLQFSVPTADIQGQHQLEQLLSHTVTKLLSPYLQCLHNIKLSLADKSPVSLNKNISLLTKYLRRFDQQVASAVETKVFWQSSGYRLQDMAKPHRRLVLDSRNQPVSVGSGFRSHQVCVVEKSYL